MELMHPQSLHRCVTKDGVIFVFPHDFSRAILVPHFPSLWEPELHKQVWVLDIRVWRRSTRAKTSFSRVTCNVEGEKGAVSSLLQTSLEVG